MLREKLRNRKGFTLIEIIVVIVILAVLMAVAVPSVMSYINEGNKAKYEAVARTVLVNAQTEYAKAVANGSDGTAAVDADKAKKQAQDNTDTRGDKHNYGDNVTVLDTNIELTSATAAAEDRDVKFVTCTIAISGTSKNVKITANKKVEIS